MKLLIGVKIDVGEHTIMRTTAKRGRPKLQKVLNMIDGFLPIELLMVETVQIQIGESLTNFIQPNLFRNWGEWSWVQCDQLSLFSVTQKLFSNCNLLRKLAAKNIAGREG